MRRIFGVLGAGMQGTAAAYDLARFANPDRIFVGDSRLEQAQRCCERVNDLAGWAVCEARQVNALDPANLGEFLSPVSVLLSCVPYWMHPRIARVAIDTCTHMCDLGGNTDITLETLSLHECAQRAGVTLIPDTGLAPGLVNSVGLLLIESLDAAESVSLYCGVLPQHPIPPFNYKLTFNIEGLLTEYMYKAIALREGEIVELETLAEVEEIEIQGLGTMEAFNTSGGTSTAPYNLKDRVRNYQYKTIRWPGHCERMRIFRDFGLWGEEPVDIKGILVKPKDLFCKVFGDSLGKIADTDQCVVRGVGIGTKNGKKIKIQADILDKECSDTGFTSMERTTGFSIAIHASAIADGRFEPGCLPYEKALTGVEFCNEIQRRGIELTVVEQAM